MGWASGSSLMADIVTAAQKHFPHDEARRDFYRDAIRAFENEDCDTLDECRGIDVMFDLALDDAGR